LLVGEISLQLTGNVKKKLKMKKYSFQFKKYIITYRFTYGISCIKLHHYYIWIIPYVIHFILHTDLVRI